LIFPPSLLASAAVGAGIGAGTGKVVDRVSKRKIKEDVEWVVAPGRSGVVVLFHPESTAEVEQGLAGATNIVRQHIDEDDTGEDKSADIYK
jgi:uncharacterized membrane protein